MQPVVVQRLPMETGDKQVTRDEIVLLARKADLWITSNERLAAVVQFANLVAAAERSACAQMVEPVDESLADEIRARGEK